MDLVNADHQATHEAEIQAKRQYFNQLAALGEISEEEYNGTSNARDAFRKRKRLPTGAPPKELAPEQKRTPPGAKKTLGLHRTSSAPVSSNTIIKETPPVCNDKSSRRPPLSATVPSPDSSVIIDTPASKQYAERRTVSDPTLGTHSLVLNYSTGVESMLGKRTCTGSRPLNGKKKPRKQDSIELVPERKQIFRGKIFYYVPPDDKSQLRRIRINRARKFGATWTKELTPHTTHIVVDKSLTFKDVMTFLKLVTLPSNIIMVSEDYPIDSIDSMFVLDPGQPQYAVRGYPETPEDRELRSTTLCLPEKNLDPKTLGSNTGAEDLGVSEESRLPSVKAIQSSAPEEDVAVEHSRSLPVSKNGNTLTNGNLEETSLHASIELDPKECSHFGDDLDKMIRVARGMEHVPIDDEEDALEDSNTPSRDQPDISGSDGESQRPPSRRLSKPKRTSSKDSSFNQQAFTCMTGGTGVTDELNPNARIIEVLQKMADYYVETKDHWRQTAYRKTIGILRRQSAKISTYDEAIRLPTIGHRLALKIEEIALTNGLRRLTEAMSDPNFHTLETFMNIYGVGINQAWKWVQQGHTSLQDLQKHASLTKNQLLGIEHYHDFLVRIPRDEVTLLGDVVRRAAASIDPLVEVIIGGSYRRGASSSGDIDFILTKPSTTSSQQLLDFLTKLTGHLTDTGFLVAALSTPSSQTGSKWHGCCVLPGAPKLIWRRIDLLLVPETEVGAALIYFTGDDIFNRSIRLLASKKGWRLNQRGLYKDVLRGPGRAKLNEGSLIEGADEKKIFAALGVPWRPPEQRICN